MGYKTVVSFSLASACAFKYQIYYHMPIFTYQQRTFSTVVPFFDMKNFSESYFWTNDTISLIGSGRLSLDECEYIYMQSFSL